MRKHLFAIMVMTLAICIFCVKSSSYAAIEDTGNAKYNAFINDGRYTQGVSWSNCYTYVSAFTTYCFGKSDPTSGVSFNSAGEIRAGDVICNGPHYFAVLKRNGNELYVAEGNYGTPGRVNIGWNYSISGDGIKASWDNYVRSIDGWHFASATNDKKAPEIKNAYITNATTKSYEVRFNVYDDSSISKVQVGCWSEKWNIDKAKWYTVSTSNNYGSATIPIADMGGHKDCWYYCNIYAWDEFGNKSKATSVKVFIDGSAPEIKNAYTTNASTKSYEVRFNIYDKSSINTVQVGCWSEKWDIDKAKWYTVPTSNNYGAVTIPISDMGGYKDCWYYCNIYAWDKFGNKSKATSVKVYICNTHKPDDGKVTQKPTEKIEGIKTYSCVKCGKDVKTESIPKLNPMISPTGAVTIRNTIANSAKRTNDVIWDKSKVKGASNYEISWRKRGESKWNTKIVGNTVRGTTTGLTIKGLYEIRVRPKSASGKYGSYSNTVYRYFHTTEKIRLASNSKGSFTMSWKRNPQATSYQIMFTTNKNGSGAAKNINTVGASAISFTKRGLKSGLTYYVQVREIMKIDGINYIGNISIPVAVKVK